MASKKTTRTTSPSKASSAAKTTTTRKTNGAAKNGNHSKRNMLLYSGLAVAAVYGIVKIPFVRKTALPVLATAATKYWGSMKGAIASA